VLVWTERNRGNGERVVCYQRVTPPPGGSFEVPSDPTQPCPTQISQPTDAEGRRLTASQPFIFVGANAVNVAYSVARSVQESGHGLADIYLAASIDGGASWPQPPVRVATSLVETACEAEPPGPTPCTSCTRTGLGPCDQPGERELQQVYLSPASVLEVNQNPQAWRRWVFGMRLPSDVLGFRQEQGTGSWTEVKILDECNGIPPVCEKTLESLEEPKAECLGPWFFAQRPDATARGTRVHLAWQAEGTDRRWDVFEAEHTVFGTPTQWACANVSSLTDGLTGHLPAVSLDGNPQVLNRLWADNNAGIWKVRAKKDLGSDVSISGANAFLPDIVRATKATPPQNTNVYAVYSRVVNPLDPVDPLAARNYDIYWNKSQDGALWELEEPLEPPYPTSTAPSLFPSITYDAQGDGLWIVWREGDGPNWAIKGQKILTP